MTKRFSIGMLLAVVGSLALIAAGCGGGGDDKGGSNGGGNVKALPASSCGPIQYKGEGDPDYLIASDLPLIGGSRTQTIQMNKAIAYLLDQQDWKAGDKKIAFQACNDATAQLAKWDPTKCSANAHAYAGNSSLIGVIGTFNSGCAAIEIPVLNQAPGGGLMLLSPANTYGCLTEPCAGDEPEKYYPSGKRTYARVAPSDPNQGAVDAKFLQSKGVKSVYILNDKEAYGLGVAKNFRGAAEALGMKVLGFSAYDPKQPNFQATFTRIKGTNPDAVFVGGLIDENSGQLINDKVAVLGDNNKVKLMLPDGFTTDAVFQRSEGGTPNANGAYFTVAGVGIDKYKGAALKFIDGFKSQLGGKPVDPYAILGAQAGQVLLDAIDKSDGGRSSVIDEVYKTKVENGLIGNFELNENGDLTGANGAALLYTVYVGKGNHLTTLLTTSPEPKLVEAARKAAAG
ncbi:MAG TPA: branched-chain amino acid ABC transporter substrate-binding protein [Gaiellaceae bacterium]|nr:branched-chain amino acid ABC transporter substrate-binding protein [Gaiellaceae bacterium]